MALAMQGYGQPKTRPTVSIVSGCQKKIQGLSYAHVHLCNSRPLYDNVGKCQRQCCSSLDDICTSHRHCARTHIGPRCARFENPSDADRDHRKRGASCYSGGPYIVLHNCLCLIYSRASPRSRGLNVTWRDTGAVKCDGPHNLH